MRFYDVAVVTLAIGAPRKWTDNVLSQHQLPEIVSVRQGVARRIPYHAIIQLALIRELHMQLGIGIANAALFADRLLDSGQATVLSVGQISLSVDLIALRRAVDARLATALESSPMRRRGRPPRRSVGG